MDNERYPYWPVPDRPVITWPNDARIAFWVIPNIEHFRFDRPGSDPRGFPDVYNYAQRDYGSRAGIWRMMEVMDRYGVRGTVALNSDVCRFYPQIIRAGSERNWEWMGHGVSNSEPLTGLAEQPERELIASVVETITTATGAKPTGWLGPGLGETERTPDLLAEAGISYVADWVADDQPFPMRVAKGRLISVPYSQELNDIPAYTRKGLTPEEFHRQTCDQFDVLYEEGAQTGKVMALALHPFLTGHPFRSKWFARSLEYITSHSRVWVTTGGEIARWYYDHYYESAPK